MMQSSDVQHWGRNIADNWALGYVEGLGHKIADGRCIHCGDAYDAIQKRIIGTTFEQLIFGELRCRGAA